MAWPRGEPSSHANKSATSCVITACEPVDAALLAIGIDVERLPVPRHALGLDLEFLRVLVAVPVNGDLRADRDHSLLEAGVRGACAGREREVPDLSFGFDFHRGVWPREAHAALDGAGQFEFFFTVAAPPVVRGHWKRSNHQRGGNNKRNEWNESHMHGYLLLSMTPLGIDDVVGRRHRRVS